MPKSYYPPETLKQALVIPQAIFEKNAGKPIFRITLADELNAKSESQAFRDLITASAGYGFTIGSYKSERISLEPLGQEITQGNLEAIYTALFSIEVFKQFYEHFGSGGSKGIPSEKIARDFLQTECGVPERQSSAIFTNIIQDAKDWFLIQNIAGGDKFVPVDLAKKKVGVIPDTLAQVQPLEITEPQEPVKTKIVQEPVKVVPPVNVSPGLQLNIEIHIAADTPDDKIESIFKNMRKYLLNNGE